MAVAGAEVVDGQDVRVRECGDRARFALEARQRGRIGRQGFGQDLHRYIAVQLRVVCPVDLTHSTGTDLVADFVATEALPARAGRGEFNGWT